MKIAVDGPAGAGKSSISKQAAKMLGLVYIDTGAMYRAVGLKAVRAGIDTNDAQSVIKLLDNLDIDIRHEGVSQHIYLDGNDVTDSIRTPEISMAASNVSKIAEVRKHLVILQRRLAENNDVIMDGRDVATCILPDAEIKIFLTASIEARALRRYNELVSSGENVCFEEVKNEMAQRDKNDTTREVSPLKIDKEATVIDTSDMDFNQSVEAVINHIKVNLK